MGRLLTWRLCQEVRDRVPPPLLVSRAARPPEAIGRPTTTAWQRLRARAGPPALGAAGLLAVVALYALFSIFGATVGMRTLLFVAAVYFIAQIKR